MVPGWYGGEPPVQRDKIAGLEKRVAALEEYVRELYLSACHDTQQRLWLRAQEREEREQGES